MDISLMSSMLNGEPWITLDRYKEAIRSESEDSELYYQLWNSLTILLDELIIQDAKLKADVEEAASSCFELADKYGYWDSH